MRFPGICLCCVMEFCEKELWELEYEGGVFVAVSCSSSKRSQKEEEVLIGCCYIVSEFFRISREELR